MSNPEITGTSFLPDFNSVSAIRYRRWRHIQDFLTRHLMAVGGIGVIVAILLIAFYLLYVVLPMFIPASMEHVATYATPGGKNDSGTLFYAMEEQNEVGLRVTSTGQAIFFSTADGSELRAFNLLDDLNARVTSFAAGDSQQTAFAFGLDNGKALVARHAYKVTYPEGTARVITPKLEFPAGQTPLILDPAGRAITKIAMQSDGDKTTALALTDDNRLLLVNIIIERSLLSDDVEIKRTESAIEHDGSAITHLLLDKEQREVYVAGADGTIAYYDISSKRNPVLVHKVHAVPDGVSITALEFLSGGISILAGDSRGEIKQWFPVRDDLNNYTLEFVRGFDNQTAPITGITPEYYRKGFIATDADGYVGLYHTTAHKLVYKEKLGDKPWLATAISPRASAILLQDEDGVEFWKIENPHPEVSWNSIWGKVWYESRQEPEYIWQSSSASSDFEPKFSLSPLAFGTLKAAFYAMLFSIPLAIFGAMYTAYFMAPRMRGYVKPTIEIMEALPTVILGFLAGLWFAPFVEKHLPGIFLLLMFLPVSVLVAAYLWQRLPSQIRNSVPEGWEAALLLPVIAVATWLAIVLSAPVENWFFGGNMPLWLTNEMGIPYEQRNSLVVGLAMGFAVIPTIFSISEDALYSVPKHLTTGSLALGATRWQTMMGVVLLTASPGIFSAVMIGLGRAVGETMIVVMATGNTAIMDLNMFQGFRALSANIAVEMPETEVNSTHYRILFLAGLVLFMATFFVNTIAEVVRQRLRNKYSSI